MDCTTCKSNRKQLEPIPYIAHEAAMARMERTIKRLWTALIVSICLWAATVGAVLFYESQFEDVVTETVETSAEGGGNAYGSIFSGNNNEVHYGEGEGNEK